MTLAGSAPAWVPLSTELSVAQPRSSLGIASASFTQRMAAERRGGAEKPLSDPSHFLDYCHQLGAGGVEVAAESLDPNSRKRFRRRAESAGMHVEVAVRLPRDQSDVSSFQDSLRAAKSVGASVVRTTLLTRPRYVALDNAEELRRFVQQSWKSVTLAENAVRRRRMKLAIENHRDMRIEELLSMMNQISSEFVGVCIDTANSLALLESPAEAVEKLAPYAISVHLKDIAVKESADGFLLSEVALGEGFLDLRGIVEDLRQARSNIRFNLEVMTDDPLEIPCLADRYWPTMGQVSGWRLASILNLVKGNQETKPLLRVSDLSHEERVQLEDENVRRSLAHASAVPRPVGEGTRGGSRRRLVGPLDRRDRRSLLPQLAATRSRDKRSRLSQARNLLEA